MYIKNKTRNVIILYKIKSNLSIRFYRDLVAVLVISLVVGQKISDANSTENPQLADDKILQDAQSLLKKLQTEVGEWYNKRSIVDWNYASNLTEENLALKLNMSAPLTNVLKRISQEAIDFPWQNIEIEEIKRQFQKLSILRAPMLSEEVRIDI